MTTENWVKSALALHATKEGVEGLVSTVINTFHQNIVTSHPGGITCTACKTQNVLPCPTTGICGGRQNCRYHGNIRQKHCTSCEQFRNEVLNKHRYKQKQGYGGPSWANTDATLWSTNPWELAKCFMAPTGYNHVTSAKDTDLPGLLSVIITHKDFETVLAEDLNSKTNSFCEARQMRNNILHSGTQKLTEAELKDYINTMKDLLSRQLLQDDKVKKAIVKLTEIEKRSIQEKDIEKVKSEAIEAMKEIGQQQKDDIISEGQLQIKAINTCVEDGKKAIIAKTEESKRTIEEETVIAKKTEYDNKKSDLKRKLIEIYKARDLTTELSPSNTEVDVQITETYVQPHMKRVSVRKRGKTEATETRDEQEKQEDIIRSYRDIFEKDPKGQDSQLCENIYISGDAGSGKSSLCKHMISTWCDVHSADSSTNTETTPTPAKKIKQENKTEMTKIDFVFYVSLRDFMSEEHVEEMIKSILPTKYIDIIPEVLDDEEEQCLIILDGLDEWTSPKQYKKHPSITKGLPNREVWSKCSFLTTTRPWKLAHLGLKSSDVDRQVNILGIDDDSSSELIDKVVDLLNTEYDRHKSAEDFENLLCEKNLYDIMSVPVMLKQLICLWHDGKSIGESQCEIYSGMFQLLFEKAESRLSNIDGYKEITETGSKIHLPKCFSNNKKCQQIIALLISLANLAFFTIFSDNKSSTLVFEKLVAEYHGMSQTEMEICLKAGILSQTKHKDKCTEQNVKVSFLHKTFQEFLAALYIALPIESPEDPVDHIIQTCDSVYKVLEMSKVFEFVAGMSPKQASRISEHIGTVASADDEILKYRQNMTDNTNVIHLQSLILDCFTEGECNGHTEMRLHLQDVTDTRLYLQDVTDTMAQYLNIKSASVDMSINHNETDMHDLRMHKLQALQYTGSYRKTIHINSDLFNILQGSSSSLTVLFLRYLDMSSLTTEQFSSFLYSLSSLLSIGFEGITMTHEQGQCLVKYISQKTQLRKINLVMNTIHDSLQEHLSEMNKNRKGNPNIKTDDDSMSTIGQEDDDSVTDDDSMSTISQEDIHKLSPQKQIQSLSNTDSDCNISTNVQSIQSPSGCNINNTYEHCYILDLSHHSQLDTLICIEDHYKTHTCTSQIYSMNLEICYLECGSALKSLQGALKLHSLYLNETCTPQAIIQVLPTLTNLQSITIWYIDFGREQLRLRPDMQHISKIKLKKVTMTRTCACGFVDSIPDTPHTVSVKLRDINIKPAEDQPQSSASDSSKNRIRDTKFVKQYIKQSPRFLVGFNFDQDDDEDDDCSFYLDFKTKGLQ